MSRPWGEKRLAIVALLQEEPGLSVSAVARRVGCSRIYVSVVANGRIPSRAGHKRRQVEELLATHPHLSHREVARRVGCAPGYVGDIVAGRTVGPERADLLRGLRDIGYPINLIARWVGVAPGRMAKIIERRDA